MSGSLRLALILLGVVFGGWLTIKVVSAVVGWVISSLLVPVLALGVIVGVLYFACSRKALSGGRRTLP